MIEVPRTGLLESAGYTQAEIVEERYRRAIYLAARINNPPYVTGIELRALNGSFDWQLARLRVDFETAGEVIAHDRNARITDNSVANSLVHLRAENIIKCGRGITDTTMGPGYIDLVYLGVGYVSFANCDSVEDEEEFSDIFVFGWDNEDVQGSKVHPALTYVAMDKLVIIDEVTHQMNQSLYGSGELY